MKELKDVGVCVWVWVGVGVLVLALGFGAWHFWYVSSNSYDRSASADLDKLAAAFERMGNEVADLREAGNLNCRFDYKFLVEEMKIGPMLIAFMKGPYYGWRGTTIKADVRIRVVKDEKSGRLVIQSCSMKGSEPQGPGTRYIYQRSVIGNSPLETIVGPCQGESYSGDSCFTESVFTTDCRNRLLEVVVDPAALQACQRFKAEGEEDLPKCKALAEKGINVFACGVYQRLKRGDTDNLIFSALATYSVWGMAYAGARGETERQLTKLLGAKESGVLFHPTLSSLEKSLNCSMVSSGGTLDVKNSVGGKLHAKKGYQEMLDTYYSGGSGFAVGGGTEGLQLTSKVVFKNKWLRPFRASDTKPEPFTCLSKARTTASMMNRRAQFRYMEEDDFQALELPYRGEELSMVIFLPRKTYGLRDLEKTVSAEKLKAWCEKLGSEDVMVSFPKFTMSSEFVWNDILRNMGCVDAFSQGEADFSGMTDFKPTWVKEARQVAALELDEEGTIIIGIDCALLGATDGGGGNFEPEKPKIFRADHAFLYIVRHVPSNCILFIGRLVQL